MPYNRPTLTELVERGRDDVDARLPGADSRMRRSVLDVLVRMHAGATSGLYGLIDHVWRQVFPDTAESEALARWATIWGVARKASSIAGGSVAITGANGSVCPVDTRLLRADGVEYRTTVSATISVGVAAVSIEAITAGFTGNAAPAQRLSFVSPVAGINATASVSDDGLSGGADEENDEALRPRLLDRIRKPPQGGSRSDYIAWALEVPGVTRAWVYPGQLGPGTVTVMFVIDGREDIVPTEGEVDAVAAHIDVLRPVTAAVTIVAPMAVPVAITLRATPPTTEVHTAIIAELDDLMRREGEPGGAILISHIREAISLAAGEMDHEVISPTGNVQLATGQIPVAGSVTFVA